MIRIRRAIGSDIPQLQKVASAAWHDAYKEVYPEEFIRSFLSGAYSEESLLRSIERDARSSVPLFLVALRADGDVIGYAHVQSEEERIYELLRLYVHPDHQRSGAGSQLLQEYLTTLTPLKKLFAWVEKDNPVGRSFYVEKGFVATDEQLETMAGHTTVLIRYELQRDGGGRQ